MTGRRARLALALLGGAIVLAAAFAAVYRDPLRARWWAHRARSKDRTVARAALLALVRMDPPDTALVCDAVTEVTLARGSPPGSFVELATSSAADPWFHYASPIRGRADPSFARKALEEVAGCSLEKETAVLVVGTWKTHDDTRVDLVVPLPGALERWVPYTLRKELPPDPR